MRTPTVSVVIPAFNAEDRIGTMLEALRGQSAEPGSFEVIVVDDGSEDGTAQVAAGFHDVRVLEPPGRVGLHAARNIALRHAACDVVAFTDDECTPDPEWIERGLARFSADPRLVILGGGMTIPVSDPPRINELLDAAWYFDQEAAVRRGHAVGGNLWVRRDAALRVGGFNERLHHYSGAGELCRLLTARGARIEYAPEVHLTHPARQTLRALASKAFRGGQALAPLRRFSRGPGPRWPQLAQPWLLLPSPRVRGVHRLHERGIRLGPLLRLRLLAAQYLFGQLPYFVGDVLGTLRGLRNSSAAPEPLDLGDGSMDPRDAKLQR